LPPDSPLETHDAARVWDMLRHARIITRMTTGRSPHDLKDDDQLRLALERAIEIIGEAAKQVSKTAESEHPNIPWKKIVQQRHIIAHDYDQLDHTKLWSVATTHIPPLIQQLEAILPEPPENPLPEAPEATP